MGKPGSAVAIAAILCLAQAMSVAALADSHDAETMSEDADSTDNGGWRFDLGAGVGVAPDYEGSEDYQLVPLFAARVQKDHYFARLQGTKLLVNVIPSPVIRLGPQLNYRFKRNNVDDDRVDDLRTVDEAWELGLFGGLRFRDVAGTKVTLGADASASRDVAAGHNGWLVDLNGLVRFPIAEGWRMGLGAGGTWASSNYMDEYFSVDEDNSRRSGLRQFSADSGVKDVGVNANLDWGFTDNWAVSFRGAYSRLLGDAEDSPVVDDRGSENQFFGGALIAYRW